MAQRKADSPTKKAGDGGSRRSWGGVAAVRARAAQVLWLAFVVCALFLAVGALLVSLGANEQNSLVSFVVQGADAVDLGIFSRRNGVFEFRGESADVRNALVNWGIGAVAYLVVGRLVDRLVRP